MISIYFMTLISGISIFQNCSNSEIDNRIQIMTNIANFEKTRIETALADDLTQAKLINNLNQVKINLNESYYSNTNNSVLPFVSHISEILNSSQFIQEITILNLTLFVQSSTNKNELNLYYGDKFNITSCTDPICINEITQSQDKIASHLIISTLFLNTTKIGFELIKFNLSEIQSIAQDATGLQNTGEVLVAIRDTNGDALFIIPTRFDPNATFNRIVYKNQTNLPIIKALKGEEGVFFNGTDYRNISVIALTRYISTYDLGLVIKFDKAEIYTPIRSLEYFFVLWMVIILIVICAGSFFLYRSIIKPIGIITKATHEFQKGKYKNQLKLIQMMNLNN